MDFQKLPLTSESETKLNLDALYKIAPSCFTEAPDPKEPKKLRHVVDFKKLRQLLGDDAMEDEREYYELTWVGKQAARREAATPINKTLRPVPENSVDWDHTQNIYIEGDNLEALKLLQKSYLGKIKMMYFDPPYNTGNDFVYHDDFNQSQHDYDLDAGNIDELGNRFIRNTDSNGKFHSDWCSMMYPRLQLAKSLLANDGVIFISIDDGEENNLKNICDEVFGETNYVCTFAWRRRKTQANLARFVSQVHEYIYVYAKSINELTLNKVPYTKEYIEKAFSNKDNDPKGPYQTGPLARPANSSNREYTLTMPNGRKITAKWSCSQDTFNKYVEEGRLYIPRDGEGMPRIKIYLSELPGMIPNTWLDNIASNDDASRMIASLFGSNAFFNYSKPIELIKYLLQLGCDKEGIVLDIFSGSATTAHAVMQLNSEDQGHRKYIMVQLPEETEKDSEAFKAGYKNICEIGEERIRRAGKKIKEDSPLTTQDLDTGFRVYRIDSSNMKDVYFAPKDVKQQQLSLFTDNVKEDRTELDLLYGCMLDWGVELSLPLSTEKVDGCTVYTVNEGDLVACFEKPISKKVVEAIADKTPLRVLFRDSCFDKDEEKINIFEQFKQLLGWSDDEAMHNIRVI